MEQITIDEIKKRELNILKIIDKICRENNLEYFLAFGTLIGAIRHEGFIPWDDDIDILMKRNDYEKFIKVFEKYNLEKYDLLNIEKDETYYYPFLKVIDNETFVEEKKFKKIDKLGVWVDIFPLDNYNSKYINEKNIKKIKTKLQLSRAYKFIKTKNKAKTIIKLLVFPFFRFRNPRKYGLIMNSIGKNSDKTTNAYCVLFSQRLKKCTFEKNLFEKKIEWKFEDSKFYIPEEYDKILKQIYGDYMKLPPENERVSGHNINVYIR